jgi:subtilisin family serine protease
VVNVSIADVGGADLPLSPRMTNAVERAWARGVVPVLAAGNSGGQSGYGNVDALVAAATTENGSLAPYSAQTAGVKWGLAAPGTITMVLASGVQLVHQGTSVAAPNIAGAVALLLGHGQTRESAIQQLTSTAVPCAGCGHGRVDVAAALGVVRTPPPVVPKAPAPPSTTTTVPVTVPLPVPDPSLLDQAPSLEALNN